MCSLSGLLRQRSVSDFLRNRRGKYARSLLSILSDHFTRPSAGLFCYQILISASKTCLLRAREPSSRRVLQPFSPTAPPHVDSHSRLKTGWRPGMSLDEFAALAEWDSDDVISARGTLKRCGTVDTLIKENGRTFLEYLKNQYESQQDLSSRIDLAAVLALENESRFAEYAAFFAEMHKISPHPMSFKFEDCHTDSF